MNLYGENGNIKALKKALESLGCNVVVKLLSLDDTLHFEDYDFVYMGTGTEANQRIVLEHLKPYQEQIKEAWNNGTYFLMTGNALELFGKQIIYSENDQVEGINLFPFVTKIENFRIVDEAFMKCKFLKDPVLGFQNHSGIQDNISSPLFEVIKGTGYKPNCQIEGIHVKNFFGTYLIGPILIRNPKLLKYFCGKLLKQKNISVEKKLNLTLEEHAYKEFIKNYYSDIN